MGGKVKRPDRDPSAPRAAPVRRDTGSRVPDRSWGADVTKATWPEWLHVAFVTDAFVTDAFARRIIG